MLTKLCHLLFYACITPQHNDSCDKGFDPVDQRGIVNLGFTQHPDFATVGFENGIQSLWNLHDIFFFNRNATEPDGGLLPDYKKRWDDSLKIVRPFVEAGIVVGFFMGDELVSAKRISWTDIETVLNTIAPIRHEHPDLFVWQNEGGTGWVDTLPGGKVPELLDVISIDDYSLSCEKQRAWYNGTLYEKLHPHQRVFLVPGSYGSLINPNMSLPEYEKVMVAQARDFYDWASSDSMVVGLAPWHWDTRPPGQTSFGKEIGTADLPLVKAEWKEIGKKIRDGCK